MGRRNREGKTERRRHYKMRQRRENGKGLGEEKREIQETKKKERKIDTLHKLIGCMRITHLNKLSYQIIDQTS